MKIGKISPNMIFILFFASYYIVPAVSVSFSIMLTLLGGFFYVILTVFQKGMVLSKNVVTYILLSLYIAFLYVVLTDSVTISTASANLGMKRFLSEFYQLSMMFLPLLFLRWATEKATKFEIKIIVIVSYAMIVYVLFLTIQALFIDPDITRHWEGFAEASTSNIANYNFVYAIPFILVFCTMIFCKTKKIIYKLIMIALIVYQMYFLLLSQYTLSVIISVIGMCLMIYFSSKGSSKKRLIVLICLMIFIFMLPSIIKFAALNVPSEQMSIRLNEIYNFLVGGDATGYNMDSRMTIYSETFQAFLSSPVWGNRQIPVSGHATFLNVLAYLGIIGGIPFFYLYFKSRKTVRLLINEQKKEFTTFFIMLILMGITNPIHTALPLMYVIWFLVPISIKLYNECKENKKI